MKFLAIIVATIIAVFVITPAFINADATVSRTIDVNKPVDIVYSVLRDFEQWHGWSQLDKSASGKMNGPKGDVGSTWEWTGDSIGIGSTTIEALEPNKLVQSKIIFISPKEGIAHELWLLEKIDSTTTKINWTYSGTASSYFARLGNLAIKDILGPLLKKGLSNLKGFLEKIPESNPEIIEES